MRHTYEQIYAPSNYDEDMCLKPPLLLWLAVLFLSRAVMLPIAIGIGHIAGVNAQAMTLLRGFWSEDQLLPAVIAIPVLYAFWRRVPSASGMVRWIWARGRIFLALAAGLDIFLPVIARFWHGDVNDQFVVALFTSGMDAYFLVYIFAARRVRDTFADFPPPAAP
ncbi:MAG TPA: DUF2919 family protein [Steroidobacteraceae bacterium]|nr:DUF2919 family protein [Steroidobacteraceae bacterium]